MIVCLGWGSLIWRPKKLPLVDPRPCAWNADGPELPIEFVRQSTNGCLTLVIDPESAALPVLWAPMQVADLSQAVEELRKRERARVDRVIGRWPNPTGTYHCREVIEKWANDRGLEGVVWTALGPQFDGERGRRPSQAEVIEYLDSLARWKRVLAEAYVRRAPPQINTLYRRAIVDRLGWDFR